MQETTETALADFIDLAIQQASVAAEKRHSTAPVFVERASATTLLVKRRDPDGISVIHRVTVTTEMGRVEDAIVNGRPEAA